MLYQKTCFEHMVLATKQRNLNAGQWDVKTEQKCWNGNKGFWVCKKEERPAVFTWAKSDSDNALEMKSVIHDVVGFKDGKQICGQQMV